MKHWLAVIGSALGLTASASPATQPQDIAPSNVYLELRGQALAQTQSSLRVSDNTIGVLMETGYPGAIATLIALVDGSASLYFSNGGGIIGAGQHQGPAAAARSLVVTAAENLSKFTPTTEFPLPTLGRTRFFVITAQGVLTAEAAEDDLGNNRLPLSPVFHAAHALIAEMRQVEERKQ
ncbi:MAG: hypothetical protein OEV63_10115 [Gammaproteobacteria bacterium]|nr:hypothetical protein [Gammaproteobacteria bacterium]